MGEFLSSCIENPGPRMVNELHKDLSLRVGAGRTRQGFLVAGLDGGRLAVLVQ